LAEIVKQFPAARDWPTFWFAQLELAVTEGDFDSAAQATRELKRLGVDVTYRHRPPERKGVGCVS
jgi:hypothetical protein